MNTRTLGLSLLLGTLLSSAGLCQSPIDAQHYKLEFEINFTTKSIIGKTTATLKSTVSSLKSVDLDLYSNLTVSSVKMGGKAVSFTRPTDKLRVTLDKTYGTGQNFTMEIDYSGKPVATGWGGMIFTTHGSSRTPVCWTLSEPWAARSWWPCKDSPDDKSTAEIWITTRSDFISASNGALQGTDVITGGKKRYRWKTTEQIVPYLISIVSTDYRVRTDTYTYAGGKMPVEFYVFPESYASWQSGMNRVVPMLQAFAKVWGEYPWVKEKYAIAQFTWGGGMEHQTIASQSSVSEWLTAHELAHQWWGDMITCASWSDIWLNEGFATYGEAVWEELKGGGSSNMNAYHNWMRNRRPYETSTPVYITNPTSINRIFSSNLSYRKGGWIVHMLRGVLGDTAFHKALADYRTTYLGKSVTTRQFQALVSKSCGRKMKFFFDQWVFAGGRPTYQYAWQHHNVGGQDYLYLQVNQTQTVQQLFEMPIQVQVTTSKGTQTHVAWNDERSDQFAVPISGSPTSVQMDPLNWILRNGFSSMSYKLPHFAATANSIDTVKGGSSELHIHRGSGASGRPYIMFAGMSGSTPGTNIGAITVPINADAFTLLAYQSINSPTFTAFAGKLDGNGLGRATFKVPVSIAVPFKGTELTFAYVLSDKVDKVSRPVTVTLD